MFLGDTIESGLNYINSTDKKRRGINVYTLSEIQAITGENKYGRMDTVNIQMPIFILTPQEREYLIRMNSYLLGLISSRMNRISSLEWTIKRKINEEDKIAERLKSIYQIYNEYNNLADIQHVIIRRRLFTILREELPDIKPDMTNFDAALRRWRKRIKTVIEDSATKIEDWVNTINSEDDFEEFQKKWVFDLMTHGACAIFKQLINGKIENCYLLPGGSVFPIRSRYVGSSTGYVQMLNAIMPKIYFSDEMLFDAYIPVSARSYGLIPLEALINKIAESLLFDRLAAERADGTKPPEKLIILGEQSKMFGDLNSVQFNMPVNESEQKRIETIVNEERRNAIRVLSGIGQPVVADISKADTFAEQSARQDKLIRDIGFVFNASPFEMALGGSEYVAGKETSLQQMRQEKEKGIYPIVRIIDKTMTSKIIPYRFGSGWMLEHATGMTEEEQLNIDIKKSQSGTYSVNEIRENRGDDPYPEEIYDKPQGYQQTNQLGTNELNPFYIKDQSKI